VRTVKYGKKQTIIIVPWLGNDEVKSLLKYLKKRLGTGGYIEDGKIVLQGDMTHRIWKVLRQWDTGDNHRKA